MTAGTRAEFRGSCTVALGSKVDSRPVNKSRLCASASAGRVRVACTSGACDTGLPAFERRSPASTENNARCARSVIKQQNDTRFGCDISRGDAAIRAIWSSTARLTCKFSARQPSRPASGSSFWFRIAATHLRLLLGCD